MSSIDYPPLVERFDLGSASVALMEANFNGFGLPDTESMSSSHAAVVSSYA